MDYTGSFKTSQLITLIVILYLLFQAVILIGGWALENIFPAHVRDIELWEFYLKKFVPIVGISFILFFIDKFFWKMPALNGLLFSVPYLEGEYTGVVKQSYGKAYHGVKAVFTQTLSKIEFELVSPGGSVSLSENVGYQKLSNRNWSIIINYRNQNPKTPMNTKKYDGVVKMTYNATNKEFYGEYYTEAGVKGTIELKKT